MKNLLIILFIGISFAYGKENDSTEIKLKQYKDMFSNGLINETEYSKLKQSVLFPSGSPVSKPKIKERKQLDTTQIKKNKLNYFFISTSINNGQGKVIYYYNGLKSTAYMGYFLSTNFLFGFSTHGFSISTGIKSKVYFTKFYNFNPQDNSDPIVVPDAKSKYYFISVPLMLDYKINVYKNRVFINIGIGAEMNSLLKQNISYNNTTINDVLNTNYNKFNSFGIIGRTGITYSINKRVSLFTNFYYERNLNTAFKLKATNLSDLLKVIPTSMSNELGIDIKF